MLTSVQPCSRSNRHRPRPAARRTDVFILRIGRREMRSLVAQIRRAQHRVQNRVRTARRRPSALPVRTRAGMSTPPSTSGRPGVRAVRVHSDPDSKVHAAPSHEHKRAHGQSAAMNPVMSGSYTMDSSVKVHAGRVRFQQSSRARAKILRRRNLEIARIAVDHPDRTQTEMLDQRNVVGRFAAVLRAASAIAPARPRIRRSACGVCTAPDAMRSTRFDHQSADHPPHASAYPSPAAPAAPRRMSLGNTVQHPLRSASVVRNGRAAS